MNERWRLRRWSKKRGLVLLVGSNGLFHPAFVQSG